MNNTFLTLATAGVLAFGVSACGGSEEQSSSSSSGSQSQQEGGSQPEPVAEVADLSGGDTTKVTLDSGFLSALEDLELTPAAVGEGRVSEAGVATFPITGGNVKVFEEGKVSPYVQGLIEHEGSGLSLESADGKKVELEDFEIDPGASVLTGKVTVDGETAVDSAPLFFLDGGTLEPLRTSDDGSRAVLEGTTVKLKQEAADLLNDTFETDALEGGLEIGVAKITVNTGGGS